MPKIRDRAPLTKLKKKKKKKQTRRGSNPGALTLEAFALCIEPREHRLSQIDQIYNI